MKPFMSIEALARHERLQRRQLQNSEADTPVILADTVHAYHNCPIKPDETHQSVLYHLLIPELVQRLSSEGLPSRCPQCDSPIDWPFPAQDACNLSDAEVTLLRWAVRQEPYYIRLAKMADWDASKRLVGRGLLKRGADLHKVRVTLEGVREHDRIGVGWWEGV